MDLQTSSYYTPPSSAPGANCAFPPSFLHSPASVSSSSYEFASCDGDLSGDEGGRSSSRLAIFQQSLNYPNGNFIMKEGLPSPASSVQSTSPDKTQYQMSQLQQQIHPGHDTHHGRVSRRDLMGRIQEAEVTTSSSNSASTSSKKEQPRTRRTRKKSPTVILRMKKFRRVKANDRERHRMHLLNSALERLRLTLPSMPQDQRLTKIETLRFAYNYIWALSRAMSVRKTLGSSSSECGGEIKPEFTEEDDDFESAQCDFVDGNYVVRVGNVRIVLDQEGSLVETLATRPSTPQPQEEEYPLEQQQQQQYLPSEEMSGCHHQIRTGNNINHNHPHFNAQHPAAHHFFPAGPNNNIVNNCEPQTTTVTTHVPGVMPFGYHHHHHHQPPHHQLHQPQTPMGQQQLRNGRSANNQSFADVDCSSNYSFASSFEDEQDNMSSLSSNNPTFDHQHQRQGSSSGYQHKIPFY